MEQHNNDSQSDESLAISPSVILWSIAAFILAILMVTFTASPIVLSASFIAKFFAVVIGTPLGLIGALIGDAVRKFAHPDSFFTSGGFFQIIGTKLFWLCVPQLIGLIIGTAIGIALILN